MIPAFGRAGGTRCEAVVVVASAFLGLQSIGALLTDNEPFVEWVVDKTIARGGITFLVARPGAGKSLLAYYIAACALTGTPVFGLLAVQQGAVAYIDLDGRKSIARMRAIAALHGVGLNDDEIATLPLFIGAQRSSADLRDPIMLQATFDELAAIPNLILVIFDTFSDLHHGKEGNPDDMTDTVAGAVEIATRFNCGVLIIHHARKNGGNELEDVRGASSIVAKADAVFILKTEREEEDNPGTLTLLQRKARLTEEARPRTLTLRTDGDVDGVLHSYSFALADISGRIGRPATTAKEAEEIITHTLWEEPDMPRVELVKQLVAAGIPQATAYRAANVHYQKKPDIGVIDVLINQETPALQGETGLSGSLRENDSHGHSENADGDLCRNGDPIATAWDTLIAWANGDCKELPESVRGAGEHAGVMHDPSESLNRYASRIFAYTVRGGTPHEPRGLHGMVRAGRRT